MMNEHALIRRYASFWRDVVPFCEAFVRGLNAHLEITIASDSSWGDMEGHQGWLSDAVEELFGLQSEVSDDAVKIAYDRSKAANPRDAIAETEAIAAIVFGGALEDGELSERDIENVRRAVAYLRANIRDTPLIFKPRLSGCGVLKACEGDFIAGSILFEMKYGWRTFRALDIRQLLTYCSLNSESQEYVISHVGLVNPRIGRVFSIGLDELCQQISGSNSGSVLRSISDFVQGAIPSGL